MSEGDRVEILEFHAARSGDRWQPQPATVLLAYLKAQRARASRRFLCRAVPVMMLALLAAQAIDGLLARGALLAQTALSVGVPAAAAVAEWRAARRLRALVRAGDAP